MTENTHWTNHFPDSVLHVSRFGIITDVDGTISPIVNEPDAAQVTSCNREQLMALKDQVALVAVVSGRSASDVHERVGIPELVYVGNHGLERWTDDGIDVPEVVQQYRPQMEAVRDALKARKLDGMLIEDKVATLSIHYRNTENPEAAAAIFRPIVEAVASKHGLKMYEGRMIFEVRPPLEINKGTAFRALVEDYKLDTALYLGDDVTDVDALNMACELRQNGVTNGIAIGVESATDTPESVRHASDFLLDGVSGVESFLVWLSNALSASSS